MHQSASIFAAMVAEQKAAHAARQRRLEEVRVIEPYRDALAHRIVGEVDDLRGGGIEPHGQKNAGRGGRALRQRKRKDLPLARAHLAKIYVDGAHAPARGKFAARLHQQMPEAGVLHRHLDGVAYELDSADDEPVAHVRENERAEVRSVPFGEVWHSLEVVVVRKLQPPDALREHMSLCADVPQVAEVRAVELLDDVELAEVEERNGLRLRHADMRELPAVWHIAPRLEVPHALFPHHPLLVVSPRAIVRVGPEISVVEHSNPPLRGLHLVVRAVLHLLQEFVDVLPGIFENPHRIAHKERGLLRERLEPRVAYRADVARLAVGVGVHLAPRTGHSALYRKDYVRESAKYRTYRADVPDENVEVRRLRAGLRAACIAEADDRVRRERHVLPAYHAERTRLVLVFVAAGELADVP